MLSEEKQKLFFFYKECKSAHDSYWVCAEDWIKRETYFSLQMYTQSICSSLNCKVHVLNENEINGNKFGIAP